MADGNAISALSLTVDKGGKVAELPGEETIPGFTKYGPGESLESLIIDNFLLFDRESGRLVDPYMAFVSEGQDRAQDPILAGVVSPEDDSEVYGGIKTSTVLMSYFPGYDIVQTAEDGKKERTIRFETPQPHIRDSFESGESDTSDTSESTDALRRELKSCVWVYTSHFWYALRKPHPIYLDLYRPYLLTARIGDYLLQNNFLGFSTDVFVADIRTYILQSLDQDRDQAGRRDLEDNEKWNEMLDTMIEWYNTCETKNRVSQSQSFQVVLEHIRPSSTSPESV